MYLASIQVGTWQNQQKSCAPHEDSVQFCSLIRLLAVCLIKVSVLSHPQSTVKTGLMSRLTWVFIGHTGHFFVFVLLEIIWTASSELGTYRLCEQRRFRRACASAQSRQNHRCSLIQAVSQEESSDRKPDPWPLWMARHAQLKFVMTECSKTQIRLTGLI